MQRHTDTPMHRCTDTPTHQRTNASTHRRINAPTHRCTNAPTHRHTDLPAWRQWSEEEGEEGWRTSLIPASTHTDRWFGDPALMNDRAWRGQERGFYFSVATILAILCSLRLPVPSTRTGFVYPHNPFKPAPEPVQTRTLDKGTGFRKQGYGWP